MELRSAHCCGNERRDVTPKYPRSQKKHEFLQNYTGRISAAVFEHRCGHFRPPMLQHPKSFQLRVFICAVADVSRGPNLRSDDTDGITDISADLNTKVVSFKAKDQKSAEAGIKALAKAGFFGAATYKGKSLKYPDSGAKDGAKANTVSLKGIHLCCTACVTASQKALQSVKGVTLIDIDRNEETIKLTGDAISVKAAVTALNKSGFYCSYSAPKK